ncbi:MAG: MBOAT family protein, partial [Spirochaetia bacterium]|nr:MBOAT family protein [Spirochaetia bacterium]
MLFNSVHYFFFAPIAIAVFFALPSRFRNAWLLVASLYFYAVFRVPFLIVLLFSIITTHFAVRAIAASATERGRKGFLLAAILANVSILYFLKYIDFSFHAWNQILHLDPCSPLYAQATGVILPMGISFFTLQAIAYAVDVYRGQIGPAKTVFHFALFKSFFPQLVAGPIMRAKDLLHQFQEEHHWKIENFEAGLRLIVLGAFKKTFVADPLGHTVDQIYGHPLEYNWISMCAGAVFHGLQVYCDFSGYSDMAIGTGRILGFQIPENFRRPFLATSLTDMWSRWHISLSTWLRDYIYIPLGGNRVAKHREYINVFVTMAVGGIWHGSDWTFLLWGLCHALTLVLERIFFANPRRKAWWESLPRVFR